jgi:hypothetical protein
MVIEMSGHALTCALHKERYHISNHEDLGQPSASDDRMLFAVCDQDDPSQAHVNAGREDRWRDQYEDRMGGVHWYSEIGSLGSRNGPLKIDSQFEMVIDPTAVRRTARNPITSTVRDLLASEVSHYNRG